MVDRINLGVLQVRILLKYECNLNQFLLVTIDLVNCKQWDTKRKVQSERCLWNYLE